MRTLANSIRIWLAAQVALGEALRRDRVLNEQFLQVRRDAARLKAVAVDQGWDLNKLTPGAVE